MSVLHTFVIYHLLKCLYFRMVRVIIEDKVENLPLNEVNGMKSYEMIRVCGKDSSWFLTVGGLRVEDDKCMSQLCLSDRSSLRIVKESTEVVPVLPQDFDHKLKNIYQHMKKVVGSNSRTFLISDYMTDNDKMNEIRDKFPEMYSNSQVYAILNDFYTLQAFFSECTPEKEALIRRNPYMLDAVIALVQNTMTRHGNMMARPRNENAVRAAAPVGVQPPAPLFSAESIAAAIQSAMRSNPRGQVATPSAPAPSSNPVGSHPAPPPQPVENHLRQVYRTQLIQLREFGFTDDEMNMHVLVESNGSLDGAIELLIAMRESMEH